MKKILAMGACFAAFPAAAQSSVTIAGVVDVFAGRMRMAGDPSGANVVNGGGLSTSWFGFLVSEDLGGGLRASAKLTSFFRADTGSMGRFDGDPFFQRDANVALSGGLGALTLGRSQAPNMGPSILSNPFAESFTFSPLILHANVNTAKWTRRTNPADTGWNDQIVYSTPTYSGLRANLHYQIGEQAKGTPGEGRKNIGISSFYINGPLTVTGYFERDQISNPVNSTPITTSIGGVNVLTTKKAWMLGGSYDFSVVKAYGSYGRTSWDVLDFASKTTTLGISAPVGPALLLAAVARTEVSGPATATRTTSTLGYDYFLSKRTDVYALVMRDSVTAQPSGTSVAMGLRHRF